MNSTFLRIFLKKCWSKHRKKRIIYSSEFFQVCLIMWWIFLLNNNFETVLLPRVSLFKLKHQILSGLSNMLRKIHLKRLWKSSMEEAHNSLRKKCLHKYFPINLFSLIFSLILSNFLWYFRILIRQISLILLSTRLHADILLTVWAYLEGLTPSQNESFYELQNHLIYWGEISLGALLLQNCIPLQLLQMRKWLIYYFFAP